MEKTNGVGVFARIQFAGWLALAAIAGTGVVCAREVPSNVREAVEVAIERMRPALVRIHVVSTDYREGREVKSQAVGSGAIITEDGYLVTNHHVAGHATRIICTLWNREEVEAELVGTDPLTDIAVVKLRSAKPRNYSPVQFGDSALLRVGDWVLAMGSPMALSQSVTLGIVSNTEMTMPRMFGRSRQFELDGEDVGSVVRWIGHDAAIYGGNSGGPLVNLQGQIVGINEISYGLGGAIPGNLARRVADELIRAGKVRRSWLGLDVQPLFKHSEGKGIIVSGVIKDSPASRAGIQAGDLLLELAGQETNVRYDEQMPDFMRLATTLPIGEEVAARGLRAGKEIEFKFVPVERGELNPPEKELKQWGLTARNISFLAAKEMRRTNTAGVLVTSVRPGGPSGEAKPALANDDVLVEVNGEPVADMGHLTTLTRKLTKEQTDPVPVVAAFDRESRRYLTVVRVGIEELRDPGLEVTKAWLPVETQVISRDIARHLGQPDLKGFYITQVYPKTTATAAGLKAGDFILAVDEEKLMATGPEHEDELSSLIRQYDFGATVELSLIRGTNRLKLPVELERSPKLKREMKKYRSEDFEFTARNVSFFDVAEEQWNPGQQGVRVEDVRSGSWAALASLYVGDLIVEIDRQPVNNVEKLKAIMDEIAKEKKCFVLMKVLRGIHTAFLELEPAWE